MNAPGITAGSFNSQEQFSATGTFPSQGNAGTSLGVFTQTFNQQCQQNVNFGTSSGQGNLYVLQNNSLAASGTITLDLYGSTTPLLDLASYNCLFRHIRWIKIWIVSGGDTSGMTIGNAGSNPWLGSWGGTNPTQTIYPGGVAFGMGEPTGVTAMAVTTAHGELLLTNNSSSASLIYGLAICGTTT